MSSRLLASCYDELWRPVTFAVGTRFRGPSRAREAALVAAQLRRLGPPAGRLIDVSCGAGGMLARVVARSGWPQDAVSAIDSSGPMLRRCAARVPGATMVEGDAAALPFADGTFAAALNLAALDLYVRPGSVVAEIARVLRPGGVVVVSTFLTDRLSRRAVEGWLDAAGLAGTEFHDFGTYLVASGTRRGEPS